MHVAVTGGAGQLGSHVLRGLLDDRAVQSVLALDLRPPRVVGEKLRFHQADVRDPDFARHLAGIDALVHLAFVVIRKLPRATFDDINVRGSQNVFRAAAHAGIRQIVYTSSVAAYGVVEGHPRPLTEDAPRVRQADFPYACAKYDVESFLDAFESDHPDTRITRIRPGVLIGARIEHPGSAAAKQRILFDMGGGPTPIVWDEDVADAVVLALKQGAHGAFNTVADDPRPAAELARMTGFHYLPIPPLVLRGSAHASALLERLGLADAIDPAWMSVKTDMLVSSEKAKRILGWTPSCPTSADVLRRFDATCPRLLDPRIAVFMRVIDAASRTAPPIAELSGVHARCHLAITGPAGGDFTVAIDNERVHVTPGIPRPPDATVTLDAHTLLDVLAGRVAPASLDGKLSSEGQPNALRVLEAMRQQLHDSSASGGGRGWLMRQVSHWLGAASP